MKLKTITQVALLALAVGTLVVPAEADAQRQPRGAKAQAPEVLFPETSRAEPAKLGVTSRFGTPLNRISADLDKERFDQVIEEGMKVADNERANDYERSVALQFVASAYLEKDDYPNAIAHFQRIVEINALPNNNHFQIMLQVAQLQMAEEMYEQALATAERFLAESGSTKPDHLVIKGNALYRLDRFQEAAEVMSQAIAAHENPPSSWSQMLMASYFELEQPLEAAKIAERLAAANPNDKNLLMNTANIYLQAEMLDKAAAVLDDMKTRGMFDSERDYQQLYRIYANIEGKEMQAVEVIKEGLEKGLLKPGQEVYTVMAQTYYFADRIPEAIDNFKKAAEYADNGESALNLARVLFNADRFAEAKAAANEALQKGVRRPGDAWMILGNIEFYGLDNRAGGIAAFQEAAKHPETKEQAERWLKQVRNR